MSNRVFIAGHNGMVGHAIKTRLEADDVEIITASRSDLDLTNQLQTKNFLKLTKPDEVYISAAKVGGIKANSDYPANFIYENLSIQTNLIHFSFKIGVKKLLFLGSSCIYPKFAKQPIVESELLTGQLEKTNEAYALAKIAGMKMCEHYRNQYGVDFRSAMPTNLYGINDNFNLNDSHVIPALIRKFHEAKIKGLSSVDVWGSGKQLREFLYVEDLADALVHIMNLSKKDYENACSESSFLNVGTGRDLSIYDLSNQISDIVGFNGQIVFNTKMPDGTPRKLLDISKLDSTGWKPKYDLKKGLEKTYKWFCENQESFRQ